MIEEDRNSTGDRGGGRPKSRARSSATPVLAALVGAADWLSAATRKNPRFRTGAVLAIAAVVGFGIWLGVRGGGGGSSNKTQKSSMAALSEQGLKKVADVLGGPMYWAGPQAGTTYELTQTPSGRLFVRYLPAGAKAGTKTPYLFVGTLPVRNAFAATQSVANRSGSVKIPVGGGAVAFYGKSLPTNVYLAFPGSNYQIEVYDPNPQRARQLVALGRIVPVSLTAPGATTGTTVAAASLARLKSLPAKLGHPVYWAGPKSGSTYELTHTGNGRIFIRYLAPGTTVGSSTPSLFVGTLPLQNAFAATQSVANRAGSVKIPIGGGGVAFYSKSLPTNVYMAFAGSNYQIEVFDPDAKRLHDLVRVGQVRPIR